MVRLIPHLTSNCTIRRLRISVPLVECLIDGQRYFLPDTLPPPTGDDLRPLCRPRLGHQPGSTPRTSSSRAAARKEFRSFSSQSEGGPPL
jgi:hypothetical protein